MNTCSYCEKEGEEVEQRYDMILQRSVLACAQHTRLTAPLSSQPPLTTRSPQRLKELIPGDDATASTARHMYRVITELIDGPVYRVYSSELREDVGIKGPRDIKTPLALLQETGLLRFNIVPVRKKHTCLYEIRLTGQSS